MGDEKMSKKCKKWYQANECELPCVTCLFALVRKYGDNEAMKNFLKRFGNQLSIVDLEPILQKLLKKYGDDEVMEILEKLEEKSLQ